MGMYTIGFKVETEFFVEVTAKNEKSAQEKAQNIMNEIEAIRVQEDMQIDLVNIVPMEESIG